MRNESYYFCIQDKYDQQICLSCSPLGKMKTNFVTDNVIIRRVGSFKN